MAGSYEEAVSMLASSSIDIFFESIAGKTFRVLAGRDPHRIIKGAAGAYSVAVYDEARRISARIGDKCAVLGFQNDMLGPCHHHGIATSAIRLATGVEVCIAVEQTTYFDFKLHINWD